MSTRGWRVAHWLLLLIFLLTATLNMRHVRAGFLTSYAADLFVPPWMYIALRGLGGGGRSRIPPLRWLGSTPARAAGGLFLGAVLTEVSQLAWPRGLFAGIFDPLDVLAYGSGLLACYVLDRASSESGRCSAASSSRRP